MSSVSEFVNQGDDYVAHCTIPGVSGYDIKVKLKVQWVHNDKQLTDISELHNSDFTYKYSCYLISLMDNFSYKLTTFSKWQNIMYSIRINHLQYVAKYSVQVVV